MNATSLWYASLIKPSFAPPSWIFGPVWSVLYVIIAITYIRVYYLVFKKIIPARVSIPFTLNLIFNLIYSPIQFHLQNNYLGAVDILLILGTLIWTIIAIKPYSRRLALWQFPYLAWVSFATILQLTITWLNR